MTKFFQFNITNFLVKPCLYFPVILALFLNLAVWFFLIFMVSPSVSWIPLHYNVNFGIDFLGPWIYIFIYPMIGFIIIILNSALAIKLFIQEMELSKLLIWSAILVQLLIFLSFFFLAINYF